MDKYELLEKFISEIQAGKKPQIKTDDEEVLEILSLAQKLAVKGKELTPEFKNNLEKVLINNIDKEKPKEKELEYKPSLFPKWAYVTALATVVILIGGLTIWQKQRSKLAAPGLLKPYSRQAQITNQVALEDKVIVEEEITEEAAAGIEKAGTGVTVTDLGDIDKELLADLSFFDDDFLELGSLGDELSSLDSDLGEVTF